jgi:DNA repair protein RadA/Sms
MKKSRTVFVCQVCGYESPKWLGKCPSCGEWNTFAEEIKEELPLERANIIITEKPTPKKLSEIVYSEQNRIKTGLEQFDFMLNGGLVNGQVILVAGEPGIGKSTLMLEIAKNLSKSGKVLYVNSEESNEQVKMRAERIGLKEENIFLYPDVVLESIIENLLSKDFKFVIIDSIQNVFSPRFSSSPGSVTQVREVASRVAEVTKYKNLITLMVGHITKEGMIAGPKTIEHVVDTIIMIDQDPKGAYRILRTVKNRFGPTDNIAVYTLTSKGFREVYDFTLISKDSLPLIGSVICPVIEGVRAIAIEIQTLVTQTQFGYPKRTSDGIDVNRLYMLTAILDKYLDTKLSMYDIYLNVTSGIEIRETASDLAVLFSIFSSLKNKEIPRDIGIFGEVGLGGEIRCVPFFELRMNELQRLGIKKVICPKGNIPNGYSLPSDVNVVEVQDVYEVLEFFKS